jgi:hypothetical protein
VTALTDSFGKIIKDYDYNPYGVEEINPVNKFGKYATISLWQQEIENITTLPLLRGVLRSGDRQYLSQSQVLRPGARQVYA